jgi:hypothetical protein
MICEVVNIHEKHERHEKIDGGMGCKTRGIMFRAREMHCCFLESVYARVQEIPESAWLADQLESLSESNG